MLHLPRHKDPPRTKSTPTRQEIIYLCKCFGVLEEKSEFNLYVIFNEFFLCKFLSVVQRNPILKAIFYSTLLLLKTNNTFRAKQQPLLFIVVCLCTLSDKKRANRGVTSLCSVRLVPRGTTSVHYCDVHIWCPVGYVDWKVPNILLAIRPQTMHTDKGLHNLTRDVSRYGIVCRYRTCSYRHWFIFRHVSKI
jgi:hypothetical protein